MNIDVGEAVSSQPAVSSASVIAVGFDFARRLGVVPGPVVVELPRITALFSLIGTQFGGDGQTTFGLPDLRGRAALGIGPGTGLQPYVLR